MIHSSALSPEADEHRRLVQDGLCILSVCETNMIAKRGIPLLQAMLANEQRIREKRLDQMGAPLAENIPGRLDGNNLDIKEIIRNFYEQDRLNFSRVTNKRLQDAQDNQSSWPPILEGATILSSPNHNLPYELEFPNSFEDVLALAANYIR
jgi:chaperone required for assembly of F1-ATPase